MELFDFLNQSGQSYERIGSEKYNPENFRSMKCSGPEKADS
jgi:hypothetical protein